MYSTVGLKHGNKIDELIYKKEKDDWWINMQE